MDDDHTQFAARLTHLKGEMSVAAFARKCEIGESLMRSYIAGAEPGLDKILRIWMSTQCSLSWLVAGEGDPTVAENTAREERAAYDLADSEFVSVPRYDVSASMGNGDEVFDEAISGSLKFRREWLRSRGIEIENARLLDSHGDSMEPLLFHRDLILIDKGAASNWGDGVYAIRLDGRLMMKRLQRIPGGVEIISENSSKYRPIQINLTDELSQREFAVIGGMRWFARES
jgi:phage repressor protein C with HTH and peptisase S24 domain